MAGPFDRYQSPWFSLREGQNIEDRRDDPWPWHTISNANREKENITPTDQTVMDRIRGIVLPEDIPAVTALGRDLGAKDVQAPTADELVRFLMNIEMMNPYEPKSGPNVPPEVSLERARNELKPRKR